VLEFVEKLANSHRRNAGKPGDFSLDALYWVRYLQSTGANRFWVCGNSQFRPIENLSFAGTSGYPEKLERVILDPHVSIPCNR